MRQTIKVRGVVIERPCMNPRSVLFPPWPQKPRQQKTAKRRTTKKGPQIEPR